MTQFIPIDSSKIEAVEAEKTLDFPTATTISEKPITSTRAEMNLPDEIIEPKAKINPPQKWPDPPKEEPRQFKIQRKPKLAIVGCSDTKDQAPFDRAREFEFWGVNNLFLNMPGPWTRWFEIHRIEFHPMRGRWERRGKPEFRGMPIKEYLQLIQALNIPVYMRQPCPLVPNAVLYPMAEMQALFGDYWTNTVSYMIALGITCEFEEIHIYGVDMAVGTEYADQRPSCEYFLGIAAGKGIKIYMPDECDLLKSRFKYGFDDHLEAPWLKKVNKMITNMQQRQAKAAQQKVLASKQVEQYTGAIQVANEMIKIWQGNEEKNR